jgi:lysophospholipase L1-like esterase
LLVLFVSILVGLGIAEAGLRALGLPADELVFLPKDGSVEWDCYCTNPRGYFVERKSSDGRTIYCVDHAGEPPRRQNLADPAFRDRLKVLTIGDSFTWGLGVKVADGWPRRLESLLPPVVGRPVVVSNWGEVGRHVMEILEGQYRPATAEIIPDLCIYGWCMNDPLWIPTGRDERANPLGPVKKAAQMDNADIDDFINVRTANLRQLREESKLQWLRRRSRVLDLALRQWEWRAIQAQTLQFYLDLYDPVKNARGLEVTWQALREMNRTQTAAGKRFVVAIFPMFVDTEGNYPLVSAHQFLSSKLNELKIEHVDLLPAYKGRRASELWVHPVDRHPNDLAHRLAAEAIADYLKQRK